MERDQNLIFVILDDGNFSIRFKNRVLNLRKIGETLSASRAQNVQLVDLTLFQHRLKRFTIAKNDGRNPFQNLFGLAGMCFYPRERDFPSDESQTDQRRGRQ